MMVMMVMMMMMMMMIFKKFFIATTYIEDRYHIFSNIVPFDTSIRNPIIKHSHGIFVLPMFARYTGF